ncbi:MAG TPA: aminoglycoside phosphotransferase family protein [Streptosporangiaceae bacterium]|nr:aminoglycoside phosphotransferase family protein [Streptosporangiaceae bacterium]
MQLPSSDCLLDEQIVACLVEAQFPGLAGLLVSRFGAGWDHELFRVGGQWILRFPQRAERVPWLLREIEILRVAAERIGPKAPRFELIGEPSEVYPYPFVGYRMLPGAGADQVPVRAELAGEIGRLLAALHRVDPRRIPPAPERWGDERCAQLPEVAPAARSALGPQLRVLAEPYLSGLEAEPDRAAPMRFIHNDICPDHLIVDAATGELTGLIDFTDAMVGDPVLDFAGLIGVGGYDFIARVADFYDLALGDGFWPRLRWLARMLTLLWLAEAVTNDPGAVPMHLAWVGRAFDQAFIDQGR